MFKLGFCIEPYFPIELLWLALRYLIVTASQRRFSHVKSKAFHYGRCVSLRVNNRNGNPALVYLSVFKIKYTIYVSYHIWVKVHTSDLMMIIRQSINILSTITTEMSELITHGPTYYIMDNWDNNIKTRRNVPIWYQHEESYLYLVIE